MFDQLIKAFYRFSTWYEPQNLNPYLSENKFLIKVKRHLSILS